jgi:predicted RNA-binding Zn-ribbon protein involved in translation (DUF1610 family)
MKSLTCPKCGSPDLAEITWNRRKCNYCGTESMLSDDRTRLELVGWQCPKCGFNNQPNTTFCGKCGAALVKICPMCLSELRIDLEFCSKCGADYEAERKALHEWLLQEAGSGQRPERGVQYLEAVLKLNPEDNHALRLRGQMYLNESRWRQAIAYRSVSIVAAVLVASPSLFCCSFGALIAAGQGTATLGEQTSQIPPPVGIGLVCVSLIGILVPVACWFFLVRGKTA